MTTQRHHSCQKYFIRHICFTALLVQDGQDPVVVLVHKQFKDHVSLQLFYSILTNHILQVKLFLTEVIKSYK